MIQIFRKCEKSIENPMGCEEITDFDNYDRPFLLCLSSQDLIENSVFGLIKEGARAARVRTSDELAGGFKIDEIPFDFLGLKYTYDKVKNKRAENLVDKFIYPFLKRGKDIKSQARKMNIFVYCNATNTYVQIENELKVRLANDGYSEEEIKDILSQISVVSIASEVDLSHVSATTFLFKDINDMEVSDKVSKRCSKKIISLNRETIVDQINDTVRIFAFNGSGEHSLREYLKEGSIAKPSLCALVSYLVQNSIKNSNSNELIPINCRLLTSLVLKFDAEFTDGQELLDDLDVSLEYGDATRYTLGEHKILSELEKVCKKLVASMRKVESKEQELSKEKHEKTTLIETIKENTSDVTFRQILIKADMNKNASPEERKVVELPTDRQIREAFEQSKTEGEGQTL